MEFESSRRSLTFSNRLAHSVLLTVAAMVPLQLPAKAEEQPTSLAEAQSKAQELFNVGKPRRTPSSLGAPQGGMDFSPPVAEQSLPASPLPAAPSSAKRGISAERLREMLSGCSEQESKGFLKTTAYINGMWVATSPEISEGAKRCLGEKESLRLARLLKSTTYSDQACKMISGNCVTLNNHTCNDEDCKYYVEYPGSAQSDKVCFKNGYCYDLDYFYCNRRNCSTYSP